MGDSRYGDKKHNRFVASFTGTDTLMLHAGRLDVKHPDGMRTMAFEAGVPESWNAILDGWAWEGDVTGVPREDRVLEDSRD